MTHLERNVISRRGGAPLVFLFTFVSVLWAPAATAECTSDVNGDGRSDGRDLGLMMSAWKTVDATTDLNGDGITDSMDLQLLLGAWGSCDPDGNVISRITPHFVAPGGQFMIEGSGLASTREVLVRGRSLDFETQRSGLLVDVPRAFEIGVAAVTLVGEVRIHRVRRGLTVSSEKTGGSTYVPTFTLDYSQCGQPPQSGSGSVDFLGGDNAGRFCSDDGYVGLTSITATVDLSGLGSDPSTGNYVNAAFYMISNPTSPSTQAVGMDYCDAGGTASNWSNCREIDFLETNGNKITQTTVHLGDGGAAAPQRFEYGFSETAGSPCFAPPSSGDPSAGIHDLTGLDMTRSFVLTVDFVPADDGATDMTVNFMQDGTAYLVYDTADGSGAEGSGAVDLDDLTTQLNDIGFWLTPSYWQGYSPQGPGNRPWWTGGCGWDALCGGVSGWKMTDISIVASGTI